MKIGQFLVQPTNWIFVHSMFSPSFLIKHCFLVIICCLLAGSQSVLGASCVCGLDYLPNGVFEPQYRNESWPGDLHSRFEDFARRPIRGITLLNARVDRDLIEYLGDAPELRCVRIVAGIINGAGLKEFARSKITCVDFVSCSFDEELLRQLAIKPNVDCLGFDRCGLAGFKGITGIRAKKLFLTRQNIDARSLELLSSCPDLRQLAYTDSTVRPEQLQSISKLGQLENLSLENDEISNLNNLASLKRLRSLNLKGNSLDDSCSLILQKLPSLRTLNLRSNHPLTSNVIGRLPGRLTHLDFWLQTDSDLQRLLHLSKITNADAHQSRVSDEGVIALKALPDLSEIDLTDTKISDRGFRALAELKRLSILRLAHTRVEHVPPALLKRQSLRELDLEETAVGNTSMSFVPYGVRKLNILGTAVTRLPERIIPSLQELKCSSSPQLVAGLVGAKSLRKLVLKDCELNRGIIHDLGRLRGLIVLELDSCKATEQSISELRALLAPTLVAVKR